MAQTAQRVEVEQAANDIITAAPNPVAVLTDAEKFDAFFARMKAETEGLQADVSTKRGRDAIAAMAYKVSQTKQSIEKARLALTEEWRTQTSKVNAAGKQISQRLDDLRDQVRAPLNAWEAKDKERVAGCEAMIKRLSQDAIVQLADTSEGLRARHDAILALVFEEEVYQEFLDQAVALKNAAIATLELAIARLEKEEADRAELEQLRAAQIERQAREAETRRLREWADQIIQHCRDCGNGIIGGQSQPFGILLHELEKKVTATVEEFGDFAADVETARVEALARVKDVMARHAEEQRVAAEQAEAQRIADAERAATEKAQREAEQRHADQIAAARAEAEETERRIEAERAAERQKAAEELAASQARIAEAERQAQAERAAAEARELARVEQERQAQAERQRLADEKAARERDIAHRNKISGEAIDAIVAFKVSRTVAEKIVLAISAGSIPHVSIAF